MLVVIDRNQKVARVEGLTSKESCWLGFYFARDFPELVKEKWFVVCFDIIEGHFSRAECYEISTRWDLSARKVADIIKAPPAPVHNCPGCECPPEKCCK